MMPFYPDKDQGQGKFTDYKGRTMDNVLKMIGAIPLFQGLNEEQLGRLRNIARDTSFNKGEVIFSEDDRRRVLRGGRRAFKSTRFPRRKGADSSTYKGRETTLAK
jgi:hypothetical protein